MAAFTVRVVLLLTAPKLAEIVVLPTFFAVDNPLVVIEATLVDEDFHVAVVVTS